MGEEQFLNASCDIVLLDVFVIVSHIKAFVHGDKMLPHSGNCSRRGQAIFLRE